MVQEVNRGFNCNLFRTIRAGHHTVEYFRQGMVSKNVIGAVCGVAETGQVGVILDIEPRESVLECVSVVVQGLAAEVDFGSKAAGFITASMGGDGSKQSVGLHDIYSRENGLTIFRHLPFQD